MTEDSCALASEQSRRRPDSKTAAAQPSGAVEDQDVWRYDQWRDARVARGQMR